MSDQAKESAQNAKRQPLTHFLVDIVSMGMSVFWYVFRRTTHMGLGPAELRVEHYLPLLQE